MAEQAGLWGYIPDFLKRWAIGHGRDPKDFVSGTSPYGEGLSGYVPSYAPSVPPMLPPIPANLTMQQPSLFDNPATSNDIEPPYDNPYSKPGPATLAGGAQRFYDRLSGKQSTYDNLSGPELTPFSSITNKLASRYEGRPRGNIVPNIAGPLIAGMIPGPLPGLLGLGASVLNQMGFHHDFNPARDSNLFYETDRGRMTWDSLAPGGGGEQAGTLNAYNMLMAIAANDPDREIQTEKGWAKAKDLAELIKLGEAPSDDTFVYTENPTNFAQMPSQYTSGGENMSNEDAIRSLDTRYGDAWNEIASRYDNYNDARDAAAEAAQELREVGEIAGDYKGVTDFSFDAVRSITKPKLDDGGKVGDPERPSIKTKTFDDGSKYVGEIKDDKRHGQGTLTTADGRKYVGGFKNGFPHGKGTYITAGGSKYVGEFKDGTWNGQFTVTYSDGSKYVGGYKDGEKHGIGTYTYADGYKFFGEWKDGQPYALEIPHEESSRYPDKKSTPVVAPAPLVDTTSDTGDDAWGDYADYGSLDADSDWDGWY